jgi:hypothetical protein
MRKRAKFFYVCLCFVLSCGPTVTRRKILYSTVTHVRVEYTRLSWLGFNRTQAQYEVVAQMTFHSKPQRSAAKGRKSKTATAKETRAKEFTHTHLPLLSPGHSVLILLGAGLVVKWTVTVHVLGAK